MAKPDKNSNAAPPKAQKKARSSKASSKVAPKGANDTAGLGKVVVRNEFYRDGYRNMLRLVLVQGIVILGLVGAMFYVVDVHQPENKYFATTEDGRLVPLVPLNEPNLSNPALLSWIAQSATEVMTFGFNDYRARLQESSRNFTRRGWESFTLALQRSRIIERVEANQQVVTAAPAGAPVILYEGLGAGGRYQWQVQLPLTVTYQSGSRRDTSNLLVTVVIVRVPTLGSPNGVGIEQWLAQGF